MNGRESSNVNRIGLAAAALSLILILGGCVAGGETAPEPPPASSSPSSEPSRTPRTPTPTSTRTLYEPPAVVAEGEAGRLVYDRAAAVSGYTAYDAVSADRPFAVEGQCEGDNPGALLAYEVFTASVDDPGRTLVEGTLVCNGAPLANGSVQTPYSGLVQIALRGRTDAVQRAWISVISNP